jgi:hypothetical protein
MGVGVGDCQRRVQLQAAREHLVEHPTGDLQVNAGKTLIILLFTIIHHGEQRGLKSLG